MLNKKKVDADVEEEARLQGWGRVWLAGTRVVMTMMDSGQETKVTKSEPPKHTTSPN